MLLCNGSLRCLMLGGEYTMVCAWLRSIALSFHSTAISSTNISAPHSSLRYDPKYFSQSPTCPLSRSSSASSRSSASTCPTQKQGRVGSRLQISGQVEINLSPLWPSRGEGGGGLGSLGRRDALRWRSRRLGGGRESVLRSRC